MAYSDKVVDHFNSPRNVGSLDKEDSDVGTGIVGAPECGDVMRLQLKVTDGVIADARFKTFGCGSAIASSSLATEWVKGRTIEEAMKIKNTKIVAVTAEATENNLRRAQAAGFDGFIGKPLDPDRFPNQIKQILRGGEIWELD